MLRSVWVLVGVSLLLRKFALSAQSLRIVNGTVANIQDHPYQVALLSYPDTEDEMLLGGGTLIGDRWVLAAAHTFSGSRTRAARVGVVVGSSSKSEGGHVIDMQGLLIHPNYSATTQDNDFALIRMKYPYTINPTARAIQLVDVDEKIPDGTMCTASGWGDTLGTGDSEQLRAVKVPIVNHELCKANYKDFVFHITENMFCAGYEDGMADACRSDSGGPLVCNNKLAGVISWGKGCAQPNYYGVYAAVARARAWIKTRTGI